MTTVKRAVQLLLLATVAAMINADTNSDECEGRNVTVKPSELDMVYGDWVLVWAVSDDPRGFELLPNVTSSHVELKLRPDNKTIEYNERNLYLGQNCTSYFANLLIPDNDDGHHSLGEDSAIEETNGVRKVVNDTAKVDFLKTMEDSLIIVYESQRYGRYLLIYKRDGHHRDTDALKAAEAHHETLAKCLGFEVKHLFTYDGVADFCHKKSAPEAEN